MKKKITLIIILALLLAGGSFFAYRYFTARQKYDIVLKDRGEFSYGEKAVIRDLVTSGKNVELLNGSEEIDTSVLGEQTVTVRFRQIHTGEEISREVVVDVQDRTAPVITVLHDSEQIVKGETIDLLPYAIVEDNLDDHVILKLEGEYDYRSAGIYPVKFVAEDASGNRSEADFTLTVVESKNDLASVYPHHPKGYDYKLIVNIHNQTVRIYRWDGSDYNDLLKIFTCSTGDSTPKRIGTWQTPINYRWKWLFGGVYGQYATRIIQTCLFHSVPYFENGKPDSLEYLEYNKLGTAASMGCVRLRVIDVKWIYDNCPIGTTVVIKDDPADTIPVQWLEQIDVNSPNRGWDPTDPDPNNPWHKN
ncbi:MAG: L,D-transpeptidase family protein [Erysipelotrichaceae bacterium]|nr:L,D-transpeptidase family protein [Erysipelotrichaceae bacterium]